MALLNRERYIAPVEAKVVEGGVVYDGGKSMLQRATYYSDKSRVSVYMHLLLAFTAQPASAWRASSALSNTLSRRARSTSFTSFNFLASHMRTSTLPSGASLFLTVSGLRQLTRSPLVTPTTKGTSDIASNLLTIRSLPSNDSGSLPSTRTTYPSIPSPRISHIKSKRSCPGVPYRWSASPSRRVIRPKSIATVVLPFLPEARVAFSVATTSISLIALMKVVLPELKGPVTTILKARAKQA